MLLEWRRRDAALVRVRVATELLVHSWVLQMVVHRCGGHLIITENMSSECFSF